MESTRGQPLCGWAIIALLFGASPGLAATRDLRDIRTGSVIPDEGYCDQPYVVITKDGNWLCTFTTVPGREGEGGQHVMSTISRDRGKTWSKPVDIEPATGPAASWAMPLLTPSGRVYVFYDYNGENVDTLGERKGIRADTLGWYCYKSSDDHGQTWSKQRYRLPVRLTECDRTNDWKGKVQMFWGIGKPIVAGGDVFLGFSKIGKYLINKSEGWFFRSDNILDEADPAKIRWTMLPDGDIGLRSPEGPVAEEHNLVELSGGRLYTVYRTVAGYPCHAYSADRGRTWTPPAFATYTPGGRRIKNPRACPRLWKTKNGKFLLWYHNHSGKNFNGRNPAWVTGGIEKDGRLYWSQPEVLLYDPNHGDRKNENRDAVRISYPDLVEEGGRYWVTETQKTIARVHEIDGTLFEGLWNQGKVKTAATRGLVLSLNSNQIEAKRAEMPTLADLRSIDGFAIDFWIAFDNLSGGQVILDTRNEAGKGVMLATTKSGTIQVLLSDGKTSYAWDCDAKLLEMGKDHHVAVIVDAGPKIISFVVDGVLCDGGAERQYGWGRFPKSLGDVNGSKQVRLGPSLRGKLKSLRIYNRYLRTSEAVANYHTGVR